MKGLIQHPIFIVILFALTLVSACTGGDPSYNGAAPNYPGPGYNGSPSPTGDPGDGGYDDAYYENYGTNEFIITSEESTSTFGLDVDTASYTIARFYLQGGNLPNKDSIRTEEFINYFDQAYPEPINDDVFSLSKEGASSYFGQPDYHLMRIGVKARDMLLSERPDANMVFVIDTSGSMSGGDRLGQVKRCIGLLVNTLREQDKIGLVIYGTSGHVVSEMTTNHQAIMDHVNNLNADGSTNAGEGLVLGYNMARANFEAGKINRVILCSDGVANTGITDPDAILAQIEEDAGNGITLTALGFGMGNYNDILMEKLADRGNGNYHYVDSNEAADQLFGNGGLKLLMVLAFDARVQVIFDPKAVEKYRLVGYENRVMDNEDFDNDAADGGEVGPGQYVTALYELELTESASGVRSLEIAQLKIRYRYSETGAWIERANAITVGDVDNEFNSASERFRFTAAVAEFAEILRDCPYAEGSSFTSILGMVPQLAGPSEVEFRELVQIAKELSGE